MTLGQTFGRTILAAFLFQNTAMSAVNVDQLLNELRDRNSVAEYRQSILKSLAQQKVTDQQRESISKYIREFGLRLLADVQDRYGLLTSQQVVHIKDKIRNAQYFRKIKASFFSDYINGTSDFEIDANGLADLTGTMVHETGHNILYEWDVDSNSLEKKMLHEFFSELLLQTYRGQALGVRGSMPHNWATAQLAVINDALQNTREERIKTAKDPWKDLLDVASREIIEGKHPEAVVMAMAKYLGYSDADSKSCLVIDNRTRARLQAERKTRVSIDRTSSTGSKGLEKCAR